MMILAGGFFAASAEEQGGYPKGSKVLFTQQDQVIKVNLATGAGQQVGTV